MKRARKGCGLLDKIVNKLPIELHVPGYQYCGPGTKLSKRIARGDPGINPLDQACKIHDIAYDKYSQGPERYKADKLLAKKAWERVKARDSTIQERATALGVTAMMRAKMGLSKIGGKLPTPRKSKKKVKKTLNTLIKQSRKAMKLMNPRTLSSAVSIALRNVKKVSKTDVTRPRVIPIPKTGGVLPLVSIFTALSAIGALASGTSNVVKTINEAQQAKQLLAESQRHNRKIEAVAIGKHARGQGMYLKPYKNGYGLYLKPSNTKNY